MDSNVERQERSYVMIKPDGVQRGLVGAIIKRFETKGFKLLALKMVSPSKTHLESHYEDLKSKKFFPDLISYMLLGPVVAMVWQGRSVVATGRKMLGATNPLDSAPGTIRGDFCIETGRNIIHASDSVESAEKEIKLWFTPEEVQSWGKDEDKWIYEN
jgi:nucleoside-diphosphate kinase